MNNQYSKRFGEATKDLVRPGFRMLRSLYRRVRGIEPHLQMSPHEHQLVRLGTHYGGWTFVDNGKLQGSILVSCGLGEDASFDVEFSARYNATVLIVDPTPRAIAHYKDIVANIGSPKSKPYVEGGTQPIAAYELSTIPPGRLVLCEKALWNENTKLRFFAPKDSAHVSHSIVNFQNDYVGTTDYIEVEAVTIDALLAEYRITLPDMIKLDIEGAEVEVLQDMLSKQVLPSQVLVEYDELSAPSKRSKTRLQATHHSLTEAGYLLIHREHTNFLYVQRSV